MLCVHVLPRDLGCLSSRGLCPRVPSAALAHPLPTLPCRGLLLVQTAQRGHSPWPRPHSSLAAESNPREQVAGASGSAGLGRTAGGGGRRPAETSENYLALKAEKPGLTCV